MTLPNTAKPVKNAEAAPEGAAPAEPKRRGRPRSAVPKRPLKSPADVKGSAEAKKLAAAVLEVLAGERSTRDAAAALAVSETRYYIAEARAIQAMVAACEPKKKGWQSTPEHELSKAKKEKSRLERECARLHALVRAAQRSVGLAPPPAKQVLRNGKARRKRRPVVRALVAARALRVEKPVAPPTPAPMATPPTTT